MEWSEYYVRVTIASLWKAGHNAAYMTYTRYCSSDWSERTAAFSVKKVYKGTSDVVDWAKASLPCSACTEINRKSCRSVWHEVMATNRFSYSERRPKSLQTRYWAPPYSAIGVFQSRKIEKATARIRQKFVWKNLVHRRKKLYNWI